MTVTLTAIDKQLRKETARMLQYDINALTPAQEVRLSRAVMLRLELDDCATKKLAGQPFDVKAYVAASEALEFLVGGAPGQSTSAHDFSGAKQELEALFAGRAEAIRRRHERLAAAEAATMADIYRREEMAAVLAALPDVGKDLPKSGDIGSGSKSGLADNVVPLRDPELLRLASREVTPQSAEDRAQSERAWRNSYGTGGAICAPAFNVDPTK